MWRARCWSRALRWRAICGTSSKDSFWASSTRMGQNHPKRFIFCWRQSTKLTLTTPTERHRLLKSWRRCCKRRRWSLMERCIPPANDRVCLNHQSQIFIPIRHILWLILYKSFFEVGKIGKLTWNNLMTNFKQSISINLHRLSKCIAINIYSSQKSSSRIEKCRASSIYLSKDKLLKKKLILLSKWSPPSFGMTAMFSNTPLLK